MTRMGTRPLVIVSMSMCLLPGVEQAFAQSAPGEAQVLPPIVVSAPASRAKRGPTQQAARVAPKPSRVVYVYSTTPAAGSGSSIDVDKIPASVNFVDSARIARTGSMNITDALLQQVPGSQHQRGGRQSVSAQRGIPRLRCFTGGWDAPGPCGLPERSTHQRSLRRYRQLGSDSNRRDQIGQRGDQQSSLRAQRPRRGGQRADEGRLQLSRCRNRHDGRLVRPGPELGCNGASRSTAIFPSTVPSKDCTTTVFAIFRPPISAVSMAMSATRTTSANSTSTWAWPTTSSVRPRPPCRSNCCSRYWGATYTTPQTSNNRVGYVNVTGKVEATPTWTVDGAVHVRVFDQKSVDGNPTGAQPCAADATQLCFNDDSTPANGLNGVQLANPFAPDGRAQ